MRKTTQLVVGGTAGSNKTSPVIICPHFDEPKDYLQLTQDDKTLIIHKDDINDLVDAIKDLHLNHMI